VLPAVLVFGVGLGLIVAPVTAAALAAAPDEQAGVASAVNNAVARTAQLLAVAVLPLVAGLSGGAYADPAAMAAGFTIAMRVTAALALVGAVVAWTMVRDDALSAEVAGEAADLEPCVGCPLDGPPVLRVPIEEQTAG